MFNKTHRAWGVCLGCAIMFFCTSGLVTNAFSIYLPYLLTCNDYTNTQVSFLITVRCFSSFIFTFLTGIYYRYIDLRKGMVFSGLLVALGFFVYGFSMNYQMNIAAAIILGMGYGLGSMVPVGMILSRWFETGLSVATGICASVTGISTLGLPTLITIMIEKYGLGKTFIAEGVFVVLLISISFLLLRSSPAQCGCKPYNNGKGEKKALINAHDSIYKPVMHGKMWLLLVPMSLFIGTYTSTAYGHLSVLITSKGISPQTASVIILISGLGVTCSKFIYGWTADRIGAFKSNWIFGTLTFLGLTFLCLISQNVVFTGISVLIYSLGLGMTTVGIIVWSHELSSPERFDMNNRWLQTGFAAGGLLFSTVPGMIADRHNGSYQIAEFLFAFFALLVLLIIQFVYRTAKTDKTA